MRRRRSEPPPAGDAEAIGAYARELGFDAVGFAAADLGADAPRRFDRFLEAGRHGDMEWLEAKADRRRDPRALWPEVRTVVALAMNYGPARSPLADLARRDRANISAYARGSDYHDVVKKRLKRLARWMVETYACDVKVFVDTAPVMEKPLAVRAGLGWQGKHTNLVSRDYGSWLFLGEIYTTLEISPEGTAEDRCGRCRQCLDICPTNAFPAPYQLDARRCISYLTIEHKGHIPRAYRRAMGNRIYGCDDCLAVCPWNKFAQQAREAAFSARAAADLPPLADLARLDDAAFRAAYAGSPIKRTGRDRFVRNVLIALGNSGDIAAVTSAVELLGDRSPLVRAMAVWALGRLLQEARFEGLRRESVGTEKDADVLLEWKTPDRDP